MYARNGGGRPGSFYHVDDINVYLGRQRGEGLKDFSCDVPHTHALDKNLGMRLCLLKH